MRIRVCRSPGARVPEEQFWRNLLLPENPQGPVEALLAERFFERVLRHTADEWYGAPFILTPWQREATRTIWGDLDENGSRRIRLAYIEIPKKTGKTEWAAGMALLALVLDPNPGCQVYIAAAGLRQTQNVFRACCKMVEQSPELRSRLLIRRSTNRIVKKRDPDSFIQAIAADGDLTDGVNPSCVIADELHRWSTRKQQENWDVLTLGGIARRNSLAIAITTAGTQDESPIAWRYHEKAIRAQQGLIHDPTFFYRIYAADPADDWTDPATWIKANPSLRENGGFLSLERLRQAYQASISTPDGERAFKRYYLNLWEQAAGERRAIDLDVWDACHGGWQARAWMQMKSDRDFLRRFTGPCWIGADLSLTTDLSALALLFQNEDGSYSVLPVFWMPADAVKKREMRDGMPYSRWAAEGWIVTTPGQVVDYREIKAAIEWAAKTFDVREICFDPYNSREISVDLLERGHKVVEVRQTYSVLSEPTKKFLDLIAQRKLQHGGHPVLRWNASCLTLKYNDSDLVRPAKPDRERDSSRIDGISATIIALARAITSRNAGTRSVYEEQGVLLI